MDLLKLSAFFYKISSIKSDMANRIMYGIVPRMAETVDYPALEVAVHGAKDIINILYITNDYKNSLAIEFHNKMKKIFEEVRFVKNQFSNIREKIEKSNELDNAKNFESYLLSIKDTLFNQFDSYLSILNNLR